MSEPTSAEIVRLPPAQAVLRDHFLGWQCRIRQLAMRQAGGRPTTGMRPRVAVAPARGDPGDLDELGQITVMIVRHEPAEITAQFRHMVRKTQDPAERYDSALKFLAAAYYQRPGEFSDEMTALFAEGSGLAGRLLAAGRCHLDFRQYSQRYLVPCQVRDLPQDDPGFQATYWHNALFNPALPGAVRVLALAPDWSLAEAEPPVQGARSAGGPGGAASV